jgi:hypothetical protein
MHCSPSRRATRPPTGAVCPVKGPQLRVPPTLSGRLPLGSWGSGKLPHAINTSAQHRHCSVKLTVKLAAVADVDVGLTRGRKHQGGGKRHPPSGSREAVLPPLPFLTLLTIEHWCEQAGANRGHRGTRVGCEAGRAIMRSGAVHARAGVGSSGAVVQARGGRKAGVWCGQAGANRCTRKQSWGADRADGGRTTGAGTHNNDLWALDF